MKTFSKKLIQLILLFVMLCTTATNIMTIYADDTHNVSFTNPVKNGDGQSIGAFIAFRLVDVETGDTKKVTETYGGMYFEDGVTAPEHSEYYRGTKYYYDSKNYRLYEFEPNETINIDIPVGTTLEAIEFCYETEFSSSYYYVPYLHLHGTTKLLVEGTNEDISDTISKGDFTFRARLDKIEAKSAYGSSNWQLDEDYTSMLGIPENLVSVLDGGDIDFGSWQLVDANWGARDLKLTLSITESIGTNPDISYDNSIMEVELLYTSEGTMGTHSLSEIKYTKIDGRVRTEVSGIEFINTTKKAATSGLSGTSARLKKYLVVDKNAEVPNAEFKFRLSAGSAVEATDTTAKVYAGVTPEKVKINGTTQEGKVVFSRGEPTSDGALTGVATENQKYTMKDIILDFSDVKFAEPGVYRYVLTEQANTWSAVSNDEEPVRIVDVHVGWNDDETELIVGGYVGYLGNVTEAPLFFPDFEYEYEDTNGDEVISDEEKEAQAEAYQEAYNAFITSIVDGSGKSADSYVNAQEPIGVEAGTKSDKYVNTLNTVDLSLTKEVRGNQASRDQYFEFEITVNNGGNGTILTLDMSEAENGVTHENEATVYLKEDMDEANQRDDDKDVEEYLLAISSTVYDSLLEQEAFNLTIVDEYYFTTGQYQTEEVFVISFGTDEAARARFMDEHPEDTENIHPLLLTELGPRQRTFVNGKEGQQIVLNDNGSVTFKLYLHHGQKAQLLGLPKNATYSITETAEPGYKTTAENEAGTALEDDIDVLFINERSGIVPTGIFMSVSGGITLILLAGVGIYLSRRRREE